jgi:hypothetical protein
MTRTIFGGLIAVFLLILYAYAIVIAISTAWCISTGCAHGYDKDLNEGIISVLNLVGGLIAALVVAELAVTEPGTVPTGRLVAIQMPTPSSILKWIATTYLLVWVLCGVAEVLVGYLWYPNVVPALTASAKSWFGIAVAAAYSYLGVKQRATP